MGREWVATVGSQGREVEVSLVRRDSGRFVLKFGDGEIEVDAAKVGPGTWSILIGTSSHLVDYEGRGSLALVASAELVLDLEDARKKQLAEAVGGGAAAQGETIRAPIAGRVVKVLAELGAEVVSGDSLLVLEAMKMENEIKATRGGTVAEIHVDSGQSVESNQLLITLS